MPPISLLIKPASSACNLNCSYCFYNSLSNIREVKNHGIMDIETLETIVRKALSEADGSCSFAFQGGEPTLAGLDFFEKLIEFQNEYNYKKLKINNSIQTNGTNIDEKWAKFLGDNKFLVGLSLDGPKDIHNTNRKDNRGQDTFNKVVKTSSLFKKYNVEFNILCVVTSKTAKHINKIYNYFKSMDFKYMQFISCLDPLYEERGSYKYSLSKEDYTVFLKSLFDQWYKDTVEEKQISIRYFDGLMENMVYGRSSSCGMNGRCTCQFVIESDGSVYPCDFYVIDKFKLGKIQDCSLKELFESEISKKFIMDSLVTNDSCNQCKWFKLCKGGCRRDREHGEQEALGENYFCKSYQEFFEYAVPKLDYILRMSYSIR